MSEPLADRYRLRFSIHVIEDEDICSDTPCTPAPTLPPLAAVDSADVEVYVPMDVGRIQLRTAYHPNMNV